MLLVALKCDLLERKSLALDRPCIPKSRHAKFVEDRVKTELMSTLKTAGCKRQWIPWKGTVRFRDDFDPAPVADSLHAAMDGLGTNESTILNILGNHCNRQRMEIAESYKVSYGKELIDALKDELHGNFEDLCVALLDPPRRYDAKVLHNAISGIGTDECALVQILPFRTNEEIQEIKQIYKEEYGNELEEDLDCDTSGDFGKLMISLSVGGRESDDWNDPQNYDKVEEVAQKIIDAGPSAWGTDEETINAILCRESPGLLRAVFWKVEQDVGKSMEEIIDEECDGSLQAGFLAIVGAVKDPSRYFARRLNDCFKGLGTKDEELIRIIVSRSEVDLENIKDIYQEMYGKSLEEAVCDECSGDYKRLLIEIIKMQD